MIFHILVLFCITRSYISVTVTINGTEVDCSLRCACCKGGEARCFSKVIYVDDFCHDGCVDTIFGYKCKNKCPVQCYTCDQYNGSICTTCNDTHYEVNSNCKKTCSVGCSDGTCNKTDGTCSPCADNFEGNKCETCIHGKYGITCSQNCTHQNCRCTLKDGCDSCKAGFYKKGTFCQTACSTGCMNGTCNDNGSCQCSKQFTPGSSCTECITGYYGIECRTKCPSGCSGGVCMRNGTCRNCLAGNYGEQCDNTCYFGCTDQGCMRNGTCNECVTGYFGEYCNKSCSVGCSNGTCMRNGICNACDTKYYGEQCNTTCSVGCSGGICMRDGSCECTQGFNGSKCEMCIGGTYGNYCQHNCSRGCLALNCERYNGFCDCQSNFTGGKCDQCEEGFYGHSCILRCSDKCVGRICSMSDGKCTNGCKDGYYPDDSGSCISCEIRYKDKDCSYEYTVKKQSVEAETPVGAIAGGIGGGVVIICIISILLLRQRIIRMFALKRLGRNSQTTSEVIRTEELNTKYTDVIHEEENTTEYINNSVALQKPKISVDSLEHYIDSLTEDGTRAVFDSFQQGLIKPYAHSQRSDNVPRNRYRGIYPYDDCRVKLRDEDSDYINASFIDGYKKSKEYIATLGPMSQQLGKEFEPFWQMVWQQKVEKIVMITNMIENASLKCEQYWPNVGTSMMYGEFRITCHSEDMYAEFTRRALTIIRSSKERSFFQLHFTCWPDKGIPDDVTAIIEFRQRVLNTPTSFKGPTLIHCSTGVGRTGTYIALDILTKEGEAERAVDIPGCVVNMRQNRPNMIQTFEQYQYLHKAVVYSLTFNCTPIKAEHFQQYMKTTRRADLNRQFQQLLHTIEQRSKQEANAVKRNKQHLAKIRANADIPGDENRPRLYLGLTTGASDYINAVYIHSFKEKNRFLVAQTPLPETVTDFLTLIVQENCSCVVSFEPDMDKQRHPSEKTLSHMQFTEWDELKNVPLSIETFLTFLNDVEENKDGPILLHCFDGASRTGLFCVVSMLLQKMAIEHEVSILNAVRKVKAMRRLAIPNLDQFIFCHESIQEYLRAFDKDVYANFAGYDK
ncbi:receptor-type tyrosine-protein phosphatase S-like isoform X3 [Mya arenaria]|uniref:receptor-type tyrosine-protein phosphatase S-like isoform X3 n=1 Tax=Mya arenaria TaxID=6604 RepID=UPI0022E155F7|nr:receptor-type tyrosine-protein phosphatase S-like isoform X3 [Mya arenaria]